MIRLRGAIVLKLSGCGNILGASENFAVELARYIGDTNFEAVVVVQTLTLAP